MNNAQKNNLKLPLFLMIVPSVVLILAIILSNITNLETAGSTGDTYVDYMNSQEDEYKPAFERMAKKPLSSAASISALAIVPCFVFGVLLFLSRKSARD